LVMTQFSHAASEVAATSLRHLHDTVPTTGNTGKTMRFVSKMTNAPSFCLEATEANISVLRKCSSGNDSQKWKLDKYGRFHSDAYPKMCMGANYAHGFIVLVDCGSEKDIIPITQFLFNCLDSSIRSIANANQVLTVQLESVGIQDQIIHLTQKEYDSPLNQQWEIEYMTSASTPVMAKQRTYSDLNFTLSSSTLSPTVSPTDSSTDSRNDLPTVYSTQSPTALLTQSPTILPTQSPTLLQTHPPSTTTVCLDDQTIRVAVQTFLNNPKHSVFVDRPIEGWKTCDVTDMESLFDRVHSGAQHFNEYIGRWDVSRIQSLKYTFYEAYAFNGDISQWQVSSVTAMDETFFEANSFNIDISEWDVASVESMYSTFFGADKFNADISGWDISSLTSSYGAFVGADSFNINLSAWNIEKVEVMSMMFYGATSFSQRLCWNVNGKDTFLMFARTSASIGPSVACRNKYNDV